MGATNPPYVDQATVGALLERSIGQITAKNASTDLGRIDPALNGFHLVETKEFSRDGMASAVKAITVQDAAGNYYVHFTGSGDGDWIYNANAYGPQGGSTASAIQQQSLEYFNDVMENIVGPGGGKNVYLTGHSQGGNSAQYVMLFSEYSDQVTACVELDGPGFSYDAIEEAKALYGEEEYERRRDRIYAYNGKSDYVSCLGQEYIVPDGHTFFVDSPGAVEDMNGDAGGLFGAMHTAPYLLDGGRLKLTDPPAQSSDFRRLVLELNEKIKQYPPDQQALMASAMMKILEDGFAGGEKAGILVPMTEEELAVLKEIFIPLLIDTFQNDPDKIHDALVSLGLPEAYTELLDAVIQEFDNLDEQTRKEVLNALMDGIVLKNGCPSFDPSKLDFIVLVEELAPIIRKMMDEHPDELGQLIRDQLEEYIEKNPDKAGVQIILTLFLMAVDAPNLVNDPDAPWLLKELAKVANGGVKLILKGSEFIARVADFIQTALKKLQEFFKGLIPDRGTPYSQANPYFQADLWTMSSCADRLRDLNRRLKALDEHMDSLYWQVGFLDLWDILTANLIAGPSWGLQQSANYLDNTVKRLEDADRQAKSLLEG